MIGYLDKGIRALNLLIPTISEYVKTVKVEDKKNKLMSFHRDYEKLLGKRRAILTKIEELKILNETLYQAMMIDI